MKMTLYSKSSFSLNLKRLKQYRFLIMQILRTDGIILRVIDFRDYDQIMTVFTQERGIVKWIFKKSQKTNKSIPEKLSPIVRAEFIYTESKGDIWKCREISISNQFLKLRESYARLETAARLINWILLSQVEHKTVPRLYQLLITYLEKISLSNNLPSLEISFLIHLLKHEGLFNVNLHCSICQKPLRSLQMCHGDHFCTIHAPIDSIIFNEEETLAWMQVAACKTFSELQAIAIPAKLPELSEKLFKNLILQ